MIDFLRLVMGSTLTQVYNTFIWDTQTIYLQLKNLKYHTQQHQETFFETNQHF